MPEETVKLVWMEKDGAMAEVHPTAVESHKAVGWKLSEGPKKAEKPATEEPKKPVETGKK